MSFYLHIVFSIPFWEPRCDMYLSVEKNFHECVGERVFSTCLDLFLSPAGIKELERFTEISDLPQGIRVRIFEILSDVYCQTRLYKRAAYEHTAEIENFIQRFAGFDRLLRFVVGLGSAHAALAE